APGEQRARGGWLRRGPGALQRDLSQRRTGRSTAEPTHHPRVAGTRVRPGPADGRSGVERTSAMTTPVLLLGGLGGLVLGAGLALALLLVADHTRAHAPSGRVHMHRSRALHLAGAVAAGLACWALTSWPVAGVLAAAGVWW